MILKYLFQPIKIGTMEVKNRIVMAPMGACVVDEEGCIRPNFIGYLVERARGGTGMITVGNSAVEPSGLASRGFITLWDNKIIPELGRMVRAVHQYDVKFGIELSHSGVQSGGVKEVKGPSAVGALTRIKSPPSEMSKDEIRKCVGAFGAAAQRCVRAGFDYVEVYAAHGYLISEFLSPYFNRRSDEYGGSFENRIRFLLEIMRECRKKVGYEFPIGVRINGDDFIKGEQGWTLADACRLAPILEKEGANYISVSFGVYGAVHAFIPPIYDDQGAFVYLAEEVKKHVSIPVAAAGKIKNPVMADNIIKEGKADLVVMGRALIADPELPEKARMGRIADIRPCIADCLGCIEQTDREAVRPEWPRGAMTCTVNPMVFREYALTDTPVGEKLTPKKILVAGAGPGGLEAARRAALSGHKVMLCESRGYIGGQLRWAAKIPGRQEIAGIIPWYERRLNNLGVEIRLNVTVTEEVVKQIKPDVLIVATGSVADIPLGYITGLDNIEEIELMTADELLEDERVAGENILVIGVDQIGLQVADYLAEQDKNVYVVGNAPHFAEKMSTWDSFYLIGRLIEKGVKRNRKVTQVEILPTDEVWIASGETKERLPPIDTIVFAGKRRPNKFLADLSVNNDIETHIIGDASGSDGVDQGTILTAIASGYELGRRLQK